MLGFSASFSTPCCFCFPRPFSSTQLTASIQTVAGMVSLANDYLISRDKPTLGFINPLLYHPLFRDRFNDILTGFNPGCDTDGFEAARGWDPVRTAVLCLSRIASDVG